MNKTILTGRLVADPEIVETEKSIAINFRVANNDASYKNTAGEWIQVAAFFECVLWKKKENPIDRVKKHLFKGVEILVEGVVSANAYIASDGKAKGNIALKVEKYQIFGRIAESTAIPAPTNPVSPAAASEQTSGSADEVPF